VVPVSEANLHAGHEALDCYVTYQPVVEAHQPLRSVTDGVAFELFGERHDPRLSGLLEGIEDRDDVPFAPTTSAVE
jgi:hypothetical protein